MPKFIVYRHKYLSLTAQAIQITKENIQQLVNFINDNKSILELNQCHAYIHKDMLCIGGKKSFDTQGSIGDYVCYTDIPGHFFTIDRFHFERLYTLNKHMDYPYEYVYHGC